MEVSVKWQGAKSFIATDKNNLEVNISPDYKNTEMISPPDLLLMSLGSCSGLFILPSAKAAGVQIDDFSISLKGIKSASPPNLFDKIIETINLVGDISLESAKTIVHNAHNKCFILKSLNPNIVIETKIAINGKSI